MICAAFMIISTPCFASKEGGEEECIYDVHMPSGKLAELKSKYPNSRYTKNHDGVIVPVADGAAAVTFGGCLHFGYETSLRINDKEPYDREKTFKRAVELVRQFGGVDADKLEKLLSNGKYKEYRTGIYGVYYPDVQELSIVWTHEKEGWTLYVRLVN